jgi:hypothetical protein
MRTAIRSLLALAVGLVPSWAVAGGPPVPEPGTGTIIAAGAVVLGVVGGYRAWRARRKDS